MPIRCARKQSRYFSIGQLALLLAIGGSALLPGQVTAASVAPTSPESLSKTAALKTAALKTAALKTARDIQQQLSDLERFPLFLSAERGAVVTASTQLSSTQFSQPSLSWVQDQVGQRYGSDRLVEDWLAYRAFEGPNYVDVIVNEQLWGLFTYYERYAFISQFGNAAKRYGYHLRIFHSGDARNQLEAARAPFSAGRAFARGVTLRGGHFCDFSQVSLPLRAANAVALPCTIFLDESSSSRLRQPL